MNQSEVEKHKNAKTPGQGKSGRRREEKRECERKYSKTEGSNKESVLEGIGRSEEGTPKSGSEPMVGGAIECGDVALERRQGKLKGWGH